MRVGVQDADEDCNVHSLESPLTISVDRQLKNKIENLVSELTVWIQKATTRVILPEEMRSDGNTEIKILWIW